MSGPVSESEITAGVRIAPGERYGFLTDTTLCIGCKACEVACKQWNCLPADDVGFTPEGYDHTRGLSHGTWRHVKFVEQAPSDGGSARWLFNSDVCKHCAEAGCLNACPTGAIYRTEHGTVNISQDVCNGCRYCVSACPFGVVAFNEQTGTASKCTFCNDRIHNGLGPACAKACPTESIQFGFRDELVARAQQRVEKLRTMGFKEAHLYGADSQGFLGGLNAFFLLLARPATYGLPDNPRLPQKRVLPESLLSIGSAVLVGLGALVAFRKRANGKGD